MAFAVNQNCRDDKGNIIIDIVNVNKQLVGNGAPSASLGQDGNVYTDALTGEQYQKQDGVWVGTVNLAAVAGSQNLASGDGVNVLPDNPVAGTTSFSMGQNVVHLGNGIRVYDPLISGAGAVEARTIKNSDGSISVSQAMDGAVTIDNNTLLSGLNNLGSGYQVATGNGGDMRTISSTSANLNIDYSVPDEKILMTVQDILFLQQINKIGAVAQLNVEGSFFSNGNINTSSVNNSQNISNNRQLVCNNGLLQWQSYSKTISDVCQNIGTGSGLVWFGNSTSNPAQGNVWGIFSSEGLVRLQQISARIVDNALYNFAPTGTLVLELGYIPQGSAVTDVNFNLIWSSAFSSGVNMPSIDFDFSQIAAPLPSIPNGASFAFRLNKTNLLLNSGSNNAECSVQLVYN